VFDHGHFKVKVMFYCKTYCRVRSIFVKPLVGFTNNSVHILRMMSRYVLHVFDQGRFKVCTNSSLNIVRQY